VPYGHVYTLRNEATISTAITILQIATGATAPCIILDASLTQRGSTTSAQEKVAWVRKSAAATVTAAVVGGTTGTILKNRPGDPAPSLQLGTALTGFVGSAEGTNTDTAFQEGFNVLNGWKYLPVPESRIHVPAASFIALIFLTAPASQLWEVTCTLQELGT
jgi:hypothetical protein